MFTIIYVHNNIKTRTILTVSSVTTDTISTYLLECQNRLTSFPVNVCAREHGTKKIQTF
jgi:hypothetical protein